MRARAGCASSRRDRPRPSAASLTSGSAICSRTSSTTSCPRCRRRGGARSRSRSCSRRGAERRRRSARARRRGARRAAAARRARAGPARRSTTCSGSTRPRRARSRSRCGGSTASRVLVLLARRLADGAQPSRARAGARRGARRSGCRSGRSASARSTGSCATGSAGRSRARRCSASTSGRAEIRSSRSSWPALSTRTSTRSQPLPVPETLEELVRARIAGLPASTREALALASALGHDRRSRCSSGPASRADALEPAVAAHVIERENGTIRFTHPLLSSVLYRDLGDERRQRPRADRGDRRRPAPARPSPRALDGRAGRRRRRACSTTPRGSRPIAARRPSPPSSPSRRSG